MPVRGTNRNRRTPSARPRTEAPARKANPPTPRNQAQPATARTTPHRDDAFVQRNTHAARTASANAVTNQTLPEVPKLRVVVTGYGDFAGVYNELQGRPNPSGVLARKLAEMGLQNATIEYRKLEVTHGAVDAFMREMRENPPDVIVSMGVSSKAQVEERPENWKGDAVDGHGQRIVEGPIDANRPGHIRLSTDLPVDAIESALREATANGTVGRRTVGTDDKSLTGANEDYFPDDSAYLCNYLNFKLTDAFGGSDRVTAGFVHVTGETSPQEMQVVVQSIVNRELARRREQPPVS